MSELKKFEFIKWYNNEFKEKQPDYVKSSQRVVMQNMFIACQAAHEHYEKQWNTRPEYNSVECNTKLDGEYVRKSDVEKEFDIMYNKLIYTCPNFGFTQKALETFLDFKKHINTLETHSVPSEGLKVGDNIYDLRGDKYKITSISIDYELQNDTGDYSYHDTLYDFCRTKEQALAESKGE